MPVRYFQTTVTADGNYFGERTWSGEQINVAWQKFDYDSSNYSLWALDAQGNLQYRSRFSNYAARYNQDDVNMENYYFEVTLTPAGTGNFEIGFMFRFRDRYGFYYLVMNGGYQDWGNKNIRLVKVTNSTHRTLVEVEHPTFVNNQDYKFRTELVGGRMKIWLNGNLIIDFTDPNPITKGAWGPWIKGQDFTKWKDITAQSITKFSASTTLQEQSIGIDYVSNEKSMLVDIRGVSEIANKSVETALANKKYEAYSLTGYRISSSTSHVQVVFDKIENSRITTKDESLIYAYQVLPTAPPSSPTNFQVTNVGLNSATYKWTHADESEDGFHILDESNNIIATVGENVTSYTEIGLREGTYYQRKVVAYNTAGNSKESNTGRFTTSETLPNPPQDFYGEPHSDSAINWYWSDKSENEKQFELIKWDEQGNIHVIAVLLANATSYRETELEADTEYTRGIRSVNTAGASSPSLPYTVKTKALLPDAPDQPPANFFGVGISDTAVLWYWEDVTNNETGFEVFDEQGKLLVTLPANEYSWIEYELNPSTQYKRRIRAVNDGGAGPSTSPALATTLGVGSDYTGRPVPPINLRADVLGTREALLLWEYDEHPLLPNDGFKLYTSTGEFVTGFQPDVREWLLNDLQPNRTYRFYMTAFNQHGDSSVSNMVTFVTPHIYTESEVIELTELEDPLEGVLYDKETVDTGRIPAFQSGVGDNLHLKVKPPTERLDNSERFAYDLYIKAFYDEPVEYYHAQEVLYRVTCTGIHADTKAPYQYVSSWIKGIVNGSNETANGKNPFTSSLSVNIPANILNRRFSVEVVDMDGNPIPAYNPLSPEGALHWTISEEGEEQSVRDSLSITKSDIFTLWGRFSHNTSGKYPASEVETSSWFYNEGTDEISSTINSNTYIGFYSKEKSDDFILDTSFRVNEPSNYGFRDNDRIGVVVAFVKDEDGKEYTISAIRNQESDSFTWRLIYNFMQKDEKILVEGSKLVPRKIPDVWGHYMEGSRIQGTRKGDHIEVVTSDTGTYELKPSSTLTIDLSSDPLLERFREPCAFGISCFSQNNVFFQEMLYTNYSMDFSAGANSKIMIWSDVAGTKNIRHTWRSAKIQGRIFEIKPGEELQFTDYVQVPSTDLTWRELIKKYELYGYSIVVNTNNPNTEVLLDTEIFDFFPNGSDEIGVLLKARLINAAQTAWYPAVHNGYYYMNQQEHFLASDDRVRIKDGSVKYSNIFTFPYVIEAKGQRYFNDMSMSYSDDTKQEFLQGTLDYGIDLQLVDNALTLASNASKGQFTSRLFDYLNAIQTWNKLEIVQDADMIKNGANLKVEVGSADVYGNVYDWYEQQVGEPIVLPDPASRIRYRLTLEEGEYKRDFVKAYYHSNPTLQAGMNYSDKILIEDNTIAILEPTLNRDAYYISRKMDFGKFINEMGEITMNIYLGENSKVRIFTCSSDDSEHDFTNPTAESPWIPVELIKREDESYTFRNRSIRKQYVALIVEMTRGEIAVENNIIDYSTPVVSDIVLKPYLYEHVRTTPVIERVTIGGFAPAGYVNEDYNVTLTAQINSDGNEHQITTKTVEELVLDYLAEQGVANLNQLSFTHYNLKWAEHYPIELRTETSGTGTIRGYAYDDVGDLQEQETIAYFDENKHTIQVSPIPQGGTPVIVRNARNELLRQVHFRDEKTGKPILTNKEYLETNETRYVFLEHTNLDPESLRVWIDINRDGTWHQQYNCKVAENRLMLPNLYEVGLPVVVTYKIKNSFCVDYNYNPTQDIALITVFTDFHKAYKETRRLDVQYEVNKQSAYYLAKEINLNPLKTTLNSGFIYLSDTVYPPFKLDVHVNPLVLLKNRPDAVLVNAFVYDEYGNPVVDEIVEVAPSAGTIQMKNRRTDHNGMVSAIFHSPQNIGDNEVNIHVRVLSKNLKYQLAKDVTIDLAEERFVEKLAILPEKTQVSKDDTLSIRVVAMGPNDERIPNRSITINASYGSVSPETGITNGLGEVYVYYTPPNELREEDALTLITAEAADNAGNLLQEQAILNILKTNSVEVIS